MVNTTEPVSTQQKVPVKYTSSNFTVHKFTAEITERKILLQVIKMHDSALIYVNDRDQLYCKDMVLAMENRYSNLPHSTALLGQVPDNSSRKIAERISKKLGKAVFLSFNLENERLLFQLVEKRLFEEIKNQPEKF